MIEGTAFRLPPLGHGSSVIAVTKAMLETFDRIQGAWRVEITFVPKQMSHCRHGPAPDKQMFEVFDLAVEVQHAEIQGALGPVQQSQEIEPIWTLAQRSGHQA